MVSTVVSIVITSFVSNYILIVNGWSCEPDQDCSIQCDGTNICAYTNHLYIECPDGYDCIFNATSLGSSTLGKYDIQNGWVDASNSNNLYVYCNGIINCDIFFICPIDGNCYFYADEGSYNYWGATMNAMDSNYLYIETRHTMGSLFDTKIICPVSTISGDEKNCIIKVDSSPDQLIYPPLRDVNIFSIESFKHVTLECDMSSGYDCGSPSIYCGVEYIDTCIITPDENNMIVDQWKCTDSTSNCQTPPTPSGLYDITCSDVMSGVSGSSDDASTSVSCSSGILVSCGLKTRDATETNMDGGYFDVNNNECTARNGVHSPEGIYATARCCIFGIDISCNSISGGYSQTDYNGQDHSTASCNSAQVLTGCSGYGAWSRIGAYSGDASTPPNTITDFNINYENNNVCTARNGDTARIKAFGECCSASSIEYSLDCITRYGEGGILSQTVCPNEYTMIGCSGYGVLGNTNAWYIENDICYSRSSNTENTWASAICCAVSHQDAAPQCVNGGIYELILELKDVSDGMFNSDIISTGIENENDESANTYSIIGDLNSNDFKNNNNKYEFYLIYGDTIESIGGESTIYLKWEQSEWLTTSFVGDPNYILGFNQIDFNPPDRSSGNDKFYGLGMSSHPNNCYLDGTSIGTDWFNCIGPLKTWHGGIASFNRGTSQSQQLYACRQNENNNAMINQMNNFIDYNNNDNNNDNNNVIINIHNLWLILIICLFIVILLIMSYINFYQKTYNQYYSQIKYVDSASEYDHHIIQYN